MAKTNSPSLPKKTYNNLLKVLIKYDNPQIVLSLYEAANKGEHDKYWPQIRLLVLNYKNLKYI